MPLTKVSNDMLQDPGGGGGGSANIDPGEPGNVPVYAADGESIEDSGEAPVEVLEGTFTPSLSFATPGNVSVDYHANRRVGHYIKIGNRIFFNIDVEGTITHSSASGDLQITGLPTAALNISNVSYAAAIAIATNVTFSGVLAAKIDANTSIVSFRGNASAGGGAAIQSGAVSSGATVRLVISGSYPVPAP